MALVAERLEGGPVSSRVSTFPDVFSVAKGGPKCAEGGGNTNRYECWQHNERIRFYS